MGSGVQSAVNMPSDYTFVADKGTVKAKATFGGMNTQKVLEAYDSAIELKLKTPQEKLDLLEKRKDAMAGIKTKAEEYLKAVSDLRGKSYLASQSGIFGYTAAEITGFDNTEGRDYVTVTVDPGVSPAEFDFQVLALAKRDSVMASTAVTSKTDPLSWTGSLSFPHVDGVSPAVSVTVTAGMSMQDLRNTLNAYTASTGVEAELIPSGSSWKLGLQSTKYAAPLTFTNSLVVPGGDETKFPASSVASADSLKAQVTYKGQTNTFASNDFSINGFNFHLVKAQAPADAAKSIKIRTDHSVVNTVSVIETWAEKHNALVNEIRLHTKASIDNLDVSGVDMENFEIGILTSNSLLSDIERNLSTELARTVKSFTSGNLTTLASAGISTNQGKLEVDVPKLTSTLQTKYDQVKDLFVIKTAPTDAKFGMTAHPTFISGDLSNGTPHIQLNKDGSGNFSAILSITGQPDTYTVTGDAITVTDNVVYIKGTEGTPFAGFEFFRSKADEIANSTSVSTDMPISQGAGDRLESYFKKLLDLTKGDFHQEDEKFSTQEKNQTELMDKLRANEMKRRALLEAKLDAAQAVMMKLQSIISQVRTMNDFMSTGAA